MTTKTDLRERFTPARDQGPRPTCLSFALSDSHAAGKSLTDEFCVNFLHYHAAQRMSPPDVLQAVSLDAAGKALESEGQPAEASWPYTPVLPADLNTWQPPACTPTEKARVTHHPIKDATLPSLLTSGIPAVVVFRPTISFFHADKDGLLPKYPNDSAFPQLHAVVAVGHGSHRGADHILVRNSWGTRWGMAGYAWLALAYLLPQIIAIVTLDPI